jgi:hypothetical protein
MEITFQPDAFSVIRLTLVLTVMLTLPGWALLSLTAQWRAWSVLSRWCLAILVSLAVYPVLFYAARVVPAVRLGRWEMTALLALCGAVCAWRWRSQWRVSLHAHLAFARLEWVALGVIAATLFTRFWIIRDWPFPASPDSLHHVLITQLTVDGGRLPTTLGPYFPIPLDLYHLGFYALTAVAQDLAQVPAHMAVLWAGQTLNGLCGLGTYLILETKVGRVGAVIGAITAGLLSFVPAMLMSWGRFTPLGSQAILLAAWWLLDHALETWKQAEAPERVWNAGLAALLTASVFLYHFRVAGYFLPLIAIAAGWELVRAFRAGRLAPVMTCLLAIGVLALVLVSPALWNALQAYVEHTASLQLPERRQVVEEFVAAYYPYSWEGITQYGTRTWLLALAFGFGLLGALRQNRIVITMLLWVVTLWMLGTAYVLNIPLLRFTNMTAVLLALYLPVSVIVGAGAMELVKLLRPEWRMRMSYGLLAVFLLGGAYSGRARAVEILPHMQFVRAADIPAMEWIRTHTETEALFAVNTLYASPISLYGTDAGYWIPYFTGRRTTAGTMLFTLGEGGFPAQIAEMSQAVKRLEQSNFALDELRRLKVSYIYIGKAGNFSGPGLDLARLGRAAGVSVVYQVDGVTILEIDPLPEIGS